MLCYCMIIEQYHTAMLESESNQVARVTTEGEEAGESSDPELLIKHPLENKWALWYFKNDRAKDWSENLKLVATFGFVEDFWA